MRQHQTNQQRFLLSGRGLGGCYIFAGMADRKIAEMRAIESAAGRGIARAILAQESTVTILNFHRWILGNEHFHPAVESKLSCRKLR